MPMINSSFFISFLLQSSTSSRFKIFHILQYMKTLFWVPLLIISLLSRVQGQELPGLKQEFLNSKVLPFVHYGFSLYDLDNKQYLLGLQDNQHFTPASNTKVFTLFSSLELLGDSIPGLQYRVSGDSLIFWGTGDPSFLHPKLDNRIVYDFLKNSNKKLFYASQNTSEPAYRNGWSVEDYQEYYQADIAPFPIYGNLVRFYSEKEAVHTIPASFEACLNNGSVTPGKTSIVRDHNTNVYTVHSSSTSKSYKTEKPFIWSDTLFVRLLQDTLHREVSLLNNYLKPNNLETVYSIPRNVVLRDMMLPSDNFLAEQLTMVVANTNYNAFVTDRLRKEMNDKYYSNFQDSIILRDGSGLSTYNKVTPKSMIELLLAIEELLPNDVRRYLFFPAGGVDGTLKTAYTLDQGEPFVFAKTGTLNAVHCQSGYLITRSGRRLAFSFLNNNYLISTSDVRNEMVRIMTFIRHNY